MPLTSTAHLPLTRVRAARPQQRLYLLWRTRSQRGHAAVEEQYERYDGKHPREKEGAKRPPLPRKVWRDENAADAEQEVRYRACEASVLQLEDGEALAGLHCVAEDISC